MNQEISLDQEVQRLGEKYALAPNQMSLVLELLVSVRSGFPETILENAEPSTHYTPHIKGDLWTI